MSTSEARSSGGFWRLPPKIKIYEALGAIADGRVRELGNGEWIVLSSDGSRQYHVVVHGDAVSSTDNGSVYRGYLGYPAIAVLMLLGRLPYDERYSSMLRGIPWRRWNEELGRYDLVLRRVLERVPDPEGLKSFVDRVYEELKRHRFRRIASQQTTLF